MDSRKWFLRSCTSIGFSMSLLFFYPASAAAPVHVSAPKKIVTVKRIVPDAKTNPKGYARFLLVKKGWGAREYGCLVNLWMRESSWRYKAKNKSSTAFGIAQMLTETSYDPAVQIRNGLRYISARYASPCGAYGFWQGRGWY